MELKIGAKKIKELPLKLENYFEVLKDMIISSLPHSIYDEESSKDYLSFKLPITNKTSQLFVTFRPRPIKESLFLQLFIEKDKLNDPLKICSKCNYTSRILTFEINHENIHELEINYCFNLIKQSYNNIRKKSKII